MEEKNETTQQKFTYEQLEQIAIQMQNKAMRAEAKLMQINFAAMRLEYLFEVLKHSTHFNETFVNACSDEIMKLLEKKEESEETKE